VKRTEKGRRVTKNSLLRYEEMDEGTSNMKNKKKKNKKKGKKGEGERGCGVKRESSVK